VTDQGVLKLGSLKQLRRLYLWKTPVTEAGAAALKKVLPQLEIIRESPMPASPQPAASSLTAPPPAT
jgi:hypothetical protein